MDWSDDACCVYPDGDVHVVDYVDFTSYGRLISPYVDNSSLAYLVSPSGDVYSYIVGGYGITDSYGSPGTLILYSDGMSYRSDGSGNIDTVNDGVMQFRNVTDSYGNNSPNAGNSSDAWHIRTGGDVYYISNVDYWSYGI